MRLLCDEMLGGLARWLRAAGHDTTVADPQAPDEMLVDRAQREGRALVSRDRRLIEKAGGRASAVLLNGDGVDAQALQLRQALGVDWLLAPFTRCMVDNTELRPATEGDLERIPEQSRVLPGPFRTCPACGRVFWPGSHVRRMLRRLEDWQAPP